MWLFPLFATADLCHDPWLAIVDGADEKHHSVISQDEALLRLSRR